MLDEMGSVDIDSYRAENKRCDAKKLPGRDSCFNEGY